MQAINVNKEFTILRDFISELWDGIDNAACQEAMKIAFQEGLSLGKFWIDEYIRFRIAEELNQDTTLRWPLSREDLDYHGDTSAYIHDALYIFDSQLGDGVKRIWDGVTGYKNWSYSEKADALCARLHSIFGTFNLIPKTLSRETSIKIIESYAGVLGESAGSLPTPNKFSAEYVVFSRDDQGIPLVRSFFSSVFSHGLYVSQAFNTNQLIADLLPVYALRNGGINFDNGEHLLNMAIHNPFVDLINRFSPFEFSSSEKYLQSLNKTRGTPLTDAEMSEYLKDVFDRLTSKEEIEAEAAEKQRIKEIIAEYSNSYAGLQLTVK